MKMILTKIALLPLLAAAVMANTTAKWYYPPSNLLVFDIYIPWPYDLFIFSVIIILAIYGIIKFIGWILAKIGC